MRMKIAFVVLTALALVACDPKAPVDSSNVSQEIDDKIAVHNGAGTHPSITIPLDRVTGDVTSARIADGTITDLDLAVDSVGSTEILDGAVGAAEISGSSIGANQLADNAVTTIKILNGQVTGLKIAINSIDSTKITDGQVQAVDIGTDAVTNAKIIDNAIGNAEMLDNAIGNVEMLDNAVANAELADNAVGNAELADNAVTAIEIAAGAVTQAKLNTDDAGTGGATAFTAIYSFRNQSGTPIMNVAVKIHCNASNANANVDLFDVTGAAVIQELTCPMSAVPIMLSFAPVTQANNTTFAVRYMVANAGETLTWRKTTVSY